MGIDQHTALDMSVKPYHNGAPEPTCGIRITEDNFKSNGLSFSISMSVPDPALSPCPS